MRKLILALMALACLGGTAAAQQVPTSNVGNFPPDLATGARQDAGNSSAAASATALGAPADAAYAGTGSGSVVALGKGQYAILSGILAGAGATADAASATTGANGSQIALLKALRDKLNGTLTVAGTVTANIGTTNGLALDTSVQAVRTALGSPFQSGGSIGNTAFGISGTLPPYAATPTFNVGTTNGLALDATLTARFGTLGQKASAGSAPVVLASDQSAVPIQGGNSSAVKTDGSATTQPVSAASLPLPAGAATSAKQPGLGTAGTPATDVLTVQGATNGTALPATIANRAITFEDAKNLTVANGGGTSAVSHDTGGASGQWAKVNALFISSQSGTYTVQGSNDNFATAVAVATGSITANTASPVTLPVLFRYYRAYMINNSGAQATGVYVQMSFTAS